MNTIHRTTGPAIPAYFLGRPRAAYQARFDRRRRPTAVIVASTDITTVAKAA